MCLEGQAASDPSVVPRWPQAVVICEKEWLEKTGGRVPGWLQGLGWLSRWGSLNKVSRMEREENRRRLCKMK